MSQSERRADTGESACGRDGGLAVSMAHGVMANEDAPRMPSEEIASLSFLTTERERFKYPDDPVLSGHVSVQEVGLMAPRPEVPLGTVSLAVGAWAGWT